MGICHTKSFSIDTNSKLVGKIFYSPINLENTNGNYFLRIFIKNSGQKIKNPFIFSTRIFQDKTSAIQYLNSTTEKYNKYINENNKNFCLESEAGELSLIAGLIIIFAILFRLCMSIFLL